MDTWFVCALRINLGPIFQTYGAKVFADFREKSLETKEVITIQAFGGIIFVDIGNLTGLIK